LLRNDVVALRPNRILLATDFAEAANAAEPDAALLAALFDAEIALVHAQPFAYRESPASAFLTNHAKDALDHKAAALRALGSRVGPTRVVWGSAAEAVLEAADSMDAGLIVVGASNQLEWSHSPSGPTAESVARFSTRPVFVARPHPHQRFQRILCGVDGSEASALAAQDALELAHRAQATLVLVHALEPSISKPETEADRTALEHWAGESTARVDRMLDELGPELARVERRHISGRAADVLRAQASESRSDVLVLGRVGTSALRRVLLGATAERLLRSLPCALLLTSPDRSG
jgi:nucleotide-binding universal stress UspA family protein